MPKKVAIDEETEAWLRTHYRDKGMTVQRLADRVGCHPDTARRVLVRLGLREYSADKYQLHPDTLQKRWNRPCIRCGCARPRPRNHYCCDRCRRLMGYSE